MKSTMNWALTLGLLLSGAAWAQDAAAETKPAEATPAAPAAEKNPEVVKIEEACIKAWGARKSMTANLLMSMSMTAAPGMSMNGEGKGWVKMLRKDGLVMSRVELEQNIVQKMGENEQKLQSKVINVTDGKVAYTLTEQMGQKMCIKNKPENAQAFDPADMFKSLRMQFKLTALPEEKLDGEEVFVIEGTPRELTPGNPVTKLRVLIGKAHGMVLKQTIFGTDGAPMQTITYEDVKFDGPVDAAVFKFEVPEGVQVIDQTGA